MGMPRRRGLTAGKSKQTADRAEHATNAAADDNDGLRLPDTSKSKTGEDKGFDRSLGDYISRCLRDNWLNWWPPVHGPFGCSEEIVRLIRKKMPMKCATPSPCPCAAPEQHNTTFIRRPAESLSNASVQSQFAFNLPLSCLGPFMRN